MTPIELALAKITSTIMAKTTDLAIDRAKDGIMKSIAPKSVKKANELYDGFLHSIQNNIEETSDAEKIKESRQRVKKSLETEFDRDFVEKQFAKMTASFNKRPAMRMVANRIKKRRKKKKKS